MAIIFPILFPLLCGMAMLVIKKLNSRTMRCAVTVALQVIQTILGLWVTFSEETTFGSFTFAKGLSIGFMSDITAKVFCLIVSVAWLLVTIYACVYMKHEKNEERFFRAKP